MCYQNIQPWGVVYFSNFLPMNYFHLKLSLPRLMSNISKCLSRFRMMPKYSKQIKFIKMSCGNAQFFVLLSAEKNSLTVFCLSSNFLHFLYPSACSGILTLDLVIMSQVFCHCYRQKPNIIYDNKLRFNCQHSLLGAHSLLSPN
jgi:hypothetical protein